MTGGKYSQEILSRNGGRKLSRTAATNNPADTNAADFAPLTTARVRT